MSAFRWLGPDRATLEALDLYEMAFINGGPYLVVVTAVAALRDADAVRFDNPRASGATARLRAGQKTKQRWRTASDITRNAAISRATAVSGGPGEPGHPVEAAVADSVLAAGSIDADALQRLPVIVRIGDDLYARGIMQERLGGFLEVLLLTLGLVVLLCAVLGIAVVGDASAAGELRWSLAIGLLSMALLLLLEWSAHPLDPHPGPVGREIARRKTAAAVPADKELRARVGARNSSVAAVLAPRVALAGSVALWVADPPFAAALGELTDPDPSVCGPQRGHGRLCTCGQQSE